jgi:Ca2+-binding EF-hand superfamily protein
MARQNSNVFAMFDQKQIAELKEAFTFIDQNADGLIDREDLVEIWTSLGTAIFIAINQPLT